MAAGLLDGGVPIPEAGADRDRTVDLLNAIRTVVVDPGAARGSRADEIDT